MSNFLKVILLLFGTSCFVSAQSTSIHWLSIDSLNEKYKQSPKKILFEVYSKDCHYCHDFEEKVLKNQWLAQYINDTYYAVKLDAFDKAPINFAGHLYQSKDGMNPLASYLLKGVIKFPTIVFIDEQLKLLNYLQGYNDVVKTEMAMRYFGDNAYKTIAWPTYQQTFQTKIH